MNSPKIKNPVFWCEVSRPDFGPGPWREEPDRAIWEDAATGVFCLAARNDFGAWCGYVALRPVHPLLDCPREDVEEMLDAPGGVTWFDVAPECLDLARTCPKLLDLLCVGFDCCHSWDFAPGAPWSAFHGSNSRLGDPSPLGSGSATYKTLDYVIDGCALLAFEVAMIESAGLDAWLDMRAETLPNFEQSRLDSEGGS